MVKNFLGASKRYVLNHLDDPAIVLLYHRVTDLAIDPQMLSVKPDNFMNMLNS